MVRAEDDAGNPASVNERIRVREVRVVDAEGQQVGVMNTDKALALAKRAGFDLVKSHQMRVLASLPYL